MIIHNRQPVHRLKVGSLVRRIYYGLNPKDKKRFLKELDELFSRYYSKARMVPPKLSMQQRGEILQHKQKTKYNLFKK